ncbi:MAG: ParA family protein [bacterium]|nr:ParA family protein [bacterium]
MQKGGVGKTTNALHIAAAMAERGRRVLLWDVDENYGATKILGVAGSGFWSTMDVVSGECSVADAIIEADTEGAEASGGGGLPPKLDFIPSSRALQGLERALLATERLGSECLKPHVEELRGMGCYDYIFVDTGPHASATTRSAYLVSDYFILSVTPDKQAIASLPDALRDVTNARRADRNPELHLLGLVLSCMDRRTTLAKEYARALDEGFVDREGRSVKFRTTISSAAAVNRAYSQNTLLLKSEPAHRVSEQYRELADEVEARISAHRETRVAGSEQPLTRGEAAYASTRREGNAGHA